MLYTWNTTAGNTSAKKKKNYIVIHFMKDSNLESKN